jgi:L-ascorbate metabolism protein UlaG (beta-lactamase superfamily)
VTYLANEGVLLRAGSSAVLVDALFGEGLAGYAHVAAEERARLERAAPPYDEVTLVLATHRHRDHFDPAAVAAFLAANPRAHFLSTPQAVEELRASLRSAGDDGAIARRGRAVLPAAGVIERHELGGVAVGVLRLHHGAGNDTQNVGFLVELAGSRVLHVGDTAATAADFAPFRLADRPVDVALLPVWFFTYSTFATAAREQIAPLRSLAFHVAVPEAPAEYHGPASSHEALLRRLAESAPGVEVLTRPGQRVVVSPPAER